MGYKKTFVDRDNILSLEYDDLIETLTVTFRNGAEYDYIGVPLEVAEEFLGAPKKTWYLKSKIIPRYEHMIKKKVAKTNNEDKSKKVSDPSGSK